MCVCDSSRQQETTKTNQDNPLNKVKQNISQIRKIRIPLADKQLKFLFQFTL